MHRRVRWKLPGSSASSDAGFAGIQTAHQEHALATGPGKEFFWRPTARQRPSKTTNHDVKAVEYWIKSSSRPARAALAAQEFRALCLHQRRHQQHQPRLQLKAARDQVLLPALDAILAKLREMAQTYADVPMLSRTTARPPAHHGGQGNGQRAGAPDRPLPQSPGSRSWAR